LRHAVAGCDAIALPFEIVPSDVPVSILETMALGLPLVTTDIACLPELVPDGAGLVIAPGRPELLADAIHDLAKDPALRERLGLAARQRAIAWQTMRDNEPRWTWLLDQCRRK
jgi:glycosyltransferase involved in cell wall biosynthesis